MTENNQPKAAVPAAPVALKGNGKFFHVLVDTDSREAPTRVEYAQWKGVHHIGVRQMYYDYATGELKFGKSGINIPLGEFPFLIDLMIQAYNEATARQFMLHSAHTVEEDYLNDVHEEVAEALARKEANK